MDTYGQDFGRLKQAFLDFLHRLPFYGNAILCSDDPTICEIAPQLSCKVTRYGFNEAAQIRAVNVRALAGQMHFTVQRRAAAALADLQVVLNLPGRHNVLNALAVIAVAHELKLADQAVLRALAEFKGVGRRFQRYGEIGARDGGTFTLVDDYGHHPAEMAATLEAARGAFPGRRLLLVFQPHRYSRTRDCFDDFVKVLAQADAVLLAEVYGAGEARIALADGPSLAQAVRLAGQVELSFIEDIAAMPQAIFAQARDADVVLCMGAGSIGAVPAKVLAMQTGSASLVQEEIRV
jgi:UDP-N-acetylmuramate--alanine ligase